MGRLGAPHGLEGFLRFQSFSGEYGHIIKLKNAALRSGNSQIMAEIESVKILGNLALIKISGYDSPEQARKLAGMELWADRKHASALAENQYYYADLVSCLIVSKGNTLAQVVAVCDGAGSALLEVRKTQGGSAYIPFRKEFVDEPDLKAGTIELIAPWILE